MTGQEGIHLCEICGCLFVCLRGTGAQNENQHHTNQTERFSVHNGYFQQK
jgi:hypothetical protein